jgi:hypothetical protein
MASPPAYPFRLRSRPSRLHGGRARHTDPDPPGSSRLDAYGASRAGSSRTPSRLACRTRPVWQYQGVPSLSGLLPPSPATPGSGCPQLRQAAATAQRPGPSTPARHTGASWRTNKSSNRRPGSATAQRCSLACIPATLAQDPSASGPGAPLFSGASSGIAASSSSRNRCRPSPCDRALPGSEYYGGSAPPGPFSGRCAYPGQRAGCPPPGTVAGRFPCSQ